MAATRQEVESWIERGKKKGATHVISVCDTFSYEDYPVFVMPEDNLAEKQQEYNGSDMQRINETIDLKNH